MPHLPPDEATRSGVIFILGLDEGSGWLVRWEASSLRRASISSNRLVTSRSMAAIPSMRPSRSRNGRIELDRHTCLVFPQCRDRKDLSGAVASFRSASVSRSGVPMTFTHTFRDDHIEGFSEHLRPPKSRRPARHPGSRSGSCLRRPRRRSHRALRGRASKKSVDVGVHWAAAGAQAPHPMIAEPLSIETATASRQSPSDGNLPDGIIWPSSGAVASGDVPDAAKNANEAP